MPTSHHGKHGAFTLIELLTVIAIIGVLASILVITVGRVRASAKSAQCQSNLRQIGQAIGLYGADNHQLIPYVLPGGNWTWVQTLSPYLGKVYPDNWGPKTSVDVDVRPFGVWACPSSEAVTRQGGYSDYSINSIINEKPNNGKPVWRLNTLIAPSRTLAVGDGTADAGAGNYCGRALGPWVAYNNSGLDGRHSGKANVLYYDFHTESIDPTTMPSNGYVTQHSLPWIAQ